MEPIGVLSHVPCSSLHRNIGSKNWPVHKKSQLVPKWYLRPESGVGGFPFEVRCEMSVFVSIPSFAPAVVSSGRVSMAGQLSCSGEIEGEIEMRSS